MKANELRIGNLIMWNDTQTKVTPEHLTMLLGKHSFRAAGVPLTKEWIEKFGFVDEDNKTWQNEIALYPAHITVGGYNYNASFFEHHNLINVQYVHQLQNLYYALTGEELIGTTQP